MEPIGPDDLLIWVATILTFIGILVLAFYVALRLVRRGR